MKIDNATKQLIRDPKKRKAWVMYQVKLQGRSLAKVADAAGVSRQCLYHVFRITYPHMEKVVADALGMAPKELFPERYTEDGLPIHRRGRPKKSITNNIKHTTKKPRRNVNDDGPGRQEAA